LATASIRAKREDLQHASTAAAAAAAVPHCFEIMQTWLASFHAFSFTSGVIVSFSIEVILLQVRSAGDRQLQQQSQWLGMLCLDWCLGN
jgi:hypothetical protein